MIYLKHKPLLLGVILSSLILGCGSSATSETTTATDTPLSSSANVGNYKIVGTSQTDCYNNSQIITCPTDVGADFYGQDAQHTSNTEQFNVPIAGIVQDVKTGLMWQQSADTNGDGKTTVADKKDISSANSYCDNLLLGGYTDWRLPTIKQLYSLINFNGIDPSGYEGTDTSTLTPFINTNYFKFAYGDTSANERIIDSQYASSTRYVGASLTDDNTGMQFGVNFADGRIKGYGLTLFGRAKTFSVMCVRGNSDYGVNNFVDNKNNTITDQATGLMWSKNDSATALNWQEALAWVQAQNKVNYLGHNDWRLPNIKELHSIVDYGRSPDSTHSAAINGVFNSTSIVNEGGQVDFAAYWSSTTRLSWHSSFAYTEANYINFGRSLGYQNGQWIDVHGAGAQRGDPKSGSADEFPTGRGPQGDVVRIKNYVRLVRDAP